MNTIGTNPTGRDCPRGTPRRPESHLRPARWRLFRARRPSALWLLAGFLLSGGAPLARAGTPVEFLPADPSPSLLEELVKEALRSNPAILAARKSWEAATRRPWQESSLPNPELTFGSMTGGNPLPFSTVGNAPLSWASFMFTQSIPWPGKLSLKGEIARTEAAQRAQDYQSVTLDVIRQVKEAYFDLYYLDQTRRILQKYRTLLEKFARIAEARYSVGQGQQQDVLRAQVEISLLVERLEMLEARRQAVQARINSLLNRSPDVPLAELPQEAVSFVDLPFSLEEMYLKAREENPEVEKERLEIRKASLELDLARKNLYPDFTASVGYFLRGGPFDNMYEYRLGIQIPLYFWRKERLGVEERLAERERSRHGYQQALQDVTYQIKDAYIQARTAQRLMELYQRGILPQATASLDAALAAYQVGRVDFLALVTDALTILTYETQYQEEQRDYFQSLVRLEQQVGHVLVPR